MLKKIAKAMALFLVILLFIGLFGFLFGSDNVTLGVSTVLAVLIYLSRDLTANPVKNTIKLILFNVIMGLTAYLSSLNLFLAIPINFISLFTIAAALSYTISSPISTPFSMQYIFLIVYPVSLSALPLRLAALITGALIIMAVRSMAGQPKSGGATEQQDFSGNRQKHRSENHCYQKWRRSESYR